MEMKVCSLRDKLQYQNQKDTGENTILFSVSQCANLQCLYNQFWYFFHFTLLISTQVMKLCCK